MTKAINKRTSAAAAMSVCLALVGVFAAPSAAYSGDDESADYYRGHHDAGGHNTNNRPLSVILMHKQALQQDGGFQYAFAADNGHRQGESIRPDGSRTGAYSYTDPDGKEISVKYTAGKDGFKIIQGDHVPKAPLSVAPLQQHQPSLGGGEGAGYAHPGRSGPPAKNRLFSAPGGPGSQFSRGDFNNAGRFDHNSGEAYAPPASYKSKFSKPQHYRVREENSAEQSRYEDDGSYDGAGDYSSHSPFRAPLAPLHAAYNGASDSSQKDDGALNSDERLPHSFGSGYAFEFAGTNGGNNGGASAEF